MAAESQPSPFGIKSTDSLSSSMPPIADPVYELSFGYVTSRMPVPGGADERGIALARTIRNCLRNLRW